MINHIEIDRSIFESLLHSKVEIKKQIVGGNSRVSVLKVKNEIIIAKQYMGNMERKRISLDREVRSLDFLRTKNVTCVPKIIQVHEDKYLAFLEYLPGEVPASNKDTLSQIVTFVKMLKIIHDQDDSFPDAVGCVKGITDFVIQIEKRLASLKTLMPKSILIQEAYDVLSKLSSLNYDSDFPSDTYSVSDFGTHNMLQINGSYKFLDLEFFGADSPVKLIADFLLHPRNKFPKPLRDIFYDDLKKFFDIDDSAVIELLPLNALNWALIVLRRLEFHKDSKKLGVENEILSLARSYLRKSQFSGKQILAEALYLDT